MDRISLNFTHLIEVYSNKSKISYSGWKVKAFNLKILKASNFERTLKQKRNSVRFNLQVEHSKNATKKS